MADYKTMYLTLFNAVTDAVKLLQKAQIEVEEMFISQEEPKITLLKLSDETEDSPESER